MAKKLNEVKSELLEKAKGRPCAAWVVRDPQTGKVAANSAGKFRHSFDGGKSWVGSEQLDGPLYRSADGGYYAEADLPEQSDEFVSEKYAAEMRAERNQRISDTDAYVQLADVTVKKTKDAQRSALTDEEKAEILAYRTALRDLPEATGWPFIDFPAPPSCIEQEVQAKVEQREKRAVYGNY